MASFNNRHWPSMFRSKHAAQPWQTRPDMSSSPLSLLSGSTSTTGSSLKHSSGGEERSPDPKPRWNPRPEQIRILESIFNSGMINPPREEIPRIRMHLQEYGQVGDANVFYWFQNRKARSKNKLRTAGGGRAATARAPPARQQAAAPVTPQPRTQQVHLLASPVQAPTSSSSSSSDRSSGSSKPPAKPAAAQAMSATAVMDLLRPLAAACPQTYYHEHPVAQAPAPLPKVQELVAAEEPIFVPLPQGYCLSAAEVAAILDAQYMHDPAQQQAPALPAGAFLGLCNEVTGPTITGQRSCGRGAGLGQYWPAGAGADDYHQLCKNTAASNTVAREVTPTHEDATKLGLLQYGFGVGTAVDAAASAAATLPLAASPDAAVTVASVAASTAGLTRLAPSTAPNGVVTNYDPLQGLADGAVGVVTGARDAATAEAVGARPGSAVLWIMDGSTGKSLTQTDVAATNLDVRTLFGEAAVLFRCVGERSGEHVPVDASGCTVQPLQHGAVYYVYVVV